MNKRPAFQFYPADWRKDPQLQMCDMATQGIWINVLCCMWEANEEGKLEGSWQDFARLLGVSEAEFKKFYLQAKRHQFCDVSHDVTKCNGNVTIINRRMHSVFLKREGGKLRQRKLRAQDSNAEVTIPSSSSSSTSSSKNPPNPPDWFEQFWKIYPRKAGKGKARESFQKISPNSGLFAKILTAVQQQIKSEQWEKDNGKFIPYPATWLNQGRWDDELPERKKTRIETLNEQYKAKRAKSE